VDFSSSSSNLIVTVKPANQRTLMNNRGSFSRTSNMSHGSHLSKDSGKMGSENGNGEHEDEDEIRDTTCKLIDYTSTEIII
jgi:hypothetical protein